jgi:ethanolaminephosphotransferase
MGQQESQMGQIINSHLQDFTEVDHNVTRHIPRELSQRDWSAFIMHFLGLDHIGHKAGPKR